MMGSAVAFDLARSANVDRVTLADIDYRRASAAAAKIASPLVRPLQLDVENFEQLVSEMEHHDVLIGATSHRHNVNLSKGAIKAGIHFCDLGGNDDIVGEQLSLNTRAQERGVTIIPNCGLAPGLANILAARGAELFDSVESIRMRVGGLPKHPIPPFNYQIVFSAEGLLNEYTGKSSVIRDGKLAAVDSLTEVEAIDFPPPFGTLEAFHTSGGASMTPKMFEGRVRELDYKTIRYPGHCEKFKTLLEVGFGSDEPVSVGSNLLTEKEIFIELLKKKIPQSGPDVVLMRVTIAGRKQSADRVLTFTMIDFYDETHNIGAMMRGTAYPTSIIAQFLARGTITQRGAMTPEQSVPLDPLLRELQTRGMVVTQEWS